MTEQMEILFDYAQKHLLPGYLYQDEAYLASDRCAEKQEEIIRAELSAEGQNHLSAMMDDLAIAQFARDRAAFLSGFHLAAELMRV